MSDETEIAALREQINRPDEERPDPLEPEARNSVVLMADGSVARRNTDKPTRLMTIFEPPAWTHYPRRPILEALRDVTDPGQCVSWNYLVSRGIDRVLHAATPLHRCAYGDTNGDGDCPHGFRRSEFVVAADGDR